MINRVNTENDSQAAVRFEIIGVEDTMLIDEIVMY